MGAENLKLRLGNTSLDKIVLSPDIDTIFFLYKYQQTTLILPLLTVFLKFCSFLRDQGMNIGRLVLSHICVNMAERMRRREHLALFI